MPGTWRLQLALAMVILLGVCWSFSELFARPSSPAPARAASRAAVDAPSSSPALAAQRSPRGRVPARTKPLLQIHGYVFTSGRAPVEHATVCSVAALDHGGDEDPCVDTDGAGRFEFPVALDVGESLVASAPGYVTVTRDIGRGPHGAATAQELHLEPAADGAILRGAVSDVYGGPVAGAVVSMAADFTRQLQAATLSEADGSFALTVGRGAGNVCARAEAYARVCQETLAPSDGNRIILTPASAIVGRVTMAATGEGVTEATVRAVNLDGLRVPINPVRSGADGAFRFDAVPPGGYLLTAISERARSAEVSVTVGVGETKEPILLAASPSVRFSATVLRGDVPCAGAEIMLAGPIDGFGEAGPDGRASIDGLPPGPYRASVVCRGRQDALPLDIADRPVHHTWTFDAAREEQTPEPVPPTRGGTIQVRVSNPEVADGPILIFANAGSILPLRARQSGREFIFDDVPVGDYRVHAFDAAEEAEPVSIRRAGEIATVQVTLRERGSISGRVVDASGTPVSEAWVAHSRESVPEGETMVGPPVLADENGAFTLPVTVGAAYSIVVNSPAGEARRHGVRSGEPIEIQIGAPAAPPLRESQTTGNLSQSTAAL